MFAKLRSYFSRPGLDAATQLPPVAPPKVKPGVNSFPSYLKTTRPSDAQLPINDRRLASTDTTTFRNGQDTRTIVRNFVAASPDLSAAVWAYTRLGVPTKYTAVAKNMDGSFNKDATLLLQQIITRFDVLPDYTTDGFTGPQSIRSISESMARELMMYGSCCGEVVLGKDRLPRRIQPISTTQIKFIADPDKTLRPIQLVGSEQVNLDVPTFIYVSLDQSLIEPYSDSPMESAIKPAIFSEDFANDIHRIVKKVVHPRQKVKLNEEMIRKYMSVEAQSDPAVATAELNSIISTIESTINGLSPDQALVYLDSMGFEVENASNSGLAAEYEVLQDMANARMSTGSKANGTILGFSAGSSNIASTEALLFQKSVTGAVTTKLNEFFSRAFTLSLRLFGQDVVAEFKYADVDLRCESDLAAFRQTQQMMILEQLSYGFISDEIASLQLTGALPPAGFKPLSGTRFRDKVDPAADPENPSNDGSTLNQNLNGDTPDTARGQNKGRDKAPPKDDPKPTEEKKAEIIAPNFTLNIEAPNTPAPTATVMKMTRDEDGNLVVTREAA